MSRFFLTTAIDYVNSRPHLGTAYEKIAADVIARYKRLAGFDVRFVMGNDEHSQNVYRKAREACLDPVVYCDRMEQEFRDVWRRLNISFDDFIRTTEPRHHQGVTTLVQRVFESGDIYEGAYDGWYCEGCEAFKQDKDLVDGLCPIHRTKPEWIKERNYFFRLSAFRDRLLEHYASHADFIQPESRRNEIVSLIKTEGLRDINISRQGEEWGIKIPFDPDFTIYVWFDALLTYIVSNDNTPACPSSFGFLRFVTRPIRRPFASFKTSFRNPCRSDGSPRRMYFRIVQRSLAHINAPAQDSQLALVNDGLNQNCQLGGFHVLLHRQLTDVVFGSLGDLRATALVSEGERSSRTVFNGQQTTVELIRFQKE